MPTLPGSETVRVRVTRMSESGSSSIWTREFTDAPMTGLIPGSQRHALPLDPSTDVLGTPHIDTDLYESLGADGGFFGQSRHGMRTFTLAYTIPRTKSGYAQADTGMQTLRDMINFFDAPNAATCLYNICFDLRDCDGSISSYVMFDCRVSQAHTYVYTGPSHSWVCKVGFTSAHAAVADLTHGPSQYRFVLSQTGAFPATDPKALVSDGSSVGFVLGIPNVYENASTGETGDIDQKLGSMSLMQFHRQVASYNVRYATRRDSYIKDLFDYTRGDLVAFRGAFHVTDGTRSGDASLSGYAHDLQGKPALEFVSIPVWVTGGFI